MSTEIRNWRSAALQAALEALAVPVIDGSREGNAWIDDNVVDPVWDPEDKVDYQNGEHAWCGDFLHYCWRRAGLRVPAVLASPGRIIHPFGHYNQKAKPGPHFCVVLGPNGQAEAFVVRDLHQQQFDNVGTDPDDLRTVATLNENGDFVDHEKVLAQCGDAVMTLNAPGSWRGHVMMVAARHGRQLLCVDGNGGYSVGPNRVRADGRWEWERRDGVGMRSYDLAEFASAKNRKPLVLVKPSRFDFDDCVLSYHTTLVAAQEWATRFNNGE